MPDALHGFLQFLGSTRFDRQTNTALRKQLGVLLGGAVLAGALAWGLAFFWSARLGHGSFVLRLGEVFVPMTFASLVYLGIAAAFVRLRR